MRFYSIVCLIIMLSASTKISAQLDIGIKVGVQMLGMFQTSPNHIFGDGNKVVNPSYGLRIGHRIGENLELSLDGDFTSGNYYNLKKANSFESKFWRQANYSLINTSALLAYKLNGSFALKTGINIFFVGKIVEETNSFIAEDPELAKSVLNKLTAASRSVGIPIGISYLKNNLEFEFKWIVGIDESNTGTYRRLETMSFNIFYHFRPK